MKCSTPAVWLVLTQCCPLALYLPTQSYYYHREEARERLRTKRRLRMAVLEANDLHNEPSTAPLNVNLEADGSSPGWYAILWVVCLLYGTVYVHILFHRQQSQFVWFKSSVSGESLQSGDWCYTRGFRFTDRWWWWQWWLCVWWCGAFKTSSKVGFLWYFTGCLLSHNEYFSVFLSTRCWLLPTLLTLV